MCVCIDTLCIVDLKIYRCTDVRIFICICIYVYTLYFLEQALMLWSHFAYTYLLVASEGCMFFVITLCVLCAIIIYTV